MKELPVGMSSSASRRTVLVGLAAGASALILPRSAGAAGELNVLAWCDHADVKLIQPFEQAHGVKVNVKTYEGTGTGLSIIEQSQPGDWDVFMVDATDVTAHCRQGTVHGVAGSDGSMVGHVCRTQQHSVCPRGW